uniref:Nuclear receptor 2C2-associated protein n=1 Tax=Nothobranchius furzeri TaxID=105023 RepID=A0A8C6PK96_NOTFU
MANSLICSLTQSRVSSVLNRDVKQFGKKFMFDNNEETCWNSDQGACQWVLLDFPGSVQVSEVKLQFQGGFSAKFFWYCFFIIATLIVFLTPHPQLSHTGGPCGEQSKNTV